MTVSHFFNNMPELYAGTHLIISRAGASSVSEIAAVGIPSILVPLPIAADDHQTANAREIGDAKAGIVLKQKDFTPARLGELLKDLMSSPKNCRKCPKTPNRSALPTPPSVLPTPSKKKFFPVRRRKTMFGLKLFKKNLLNLLPEVRGKYTPNVRLAKYTWFGVGGPAEVLYTPADAEDLSHFLKTSPTTFPSASSAAVQICWSGTAAFPALSSGSTAPASAKYLSAKIPLPAAQALKMLN